LAFEHLNGSCCCKAETFSGKRSRLKGGYSQDWLPHSNGGITVFGITGRRNRLPHLLRQTIDPARWAGGFACRSNGHNQWSASKMNFDSCLRCAWMYTGATMNDTMQRRGFLTRSMGIAALSALPAAGDLKRRHGVKIKIALN